MLFTFSHAAFSSSFFFAFFSALACYRCSFFDNSSSWAATERQKKPANNIKTTFLIFIYLN